MKTKMDFFILFVFFIKIVFVIASLGHIYFHFRPNPSLDNRFVFWKEKTEFIFIISMSLVLLITFHPFESIRPHLTKETEFLFYLFAWVLLLTANWRQFFTQGESQPKPTPNKLVVNHGAP
jgi:hypothetical protein